MQTASCSCSAPEPRSPSHAVWLAAVLFHAALVPTMAAPNVVVWGVDDPGVPLDLTPPAHLTNAVAVAAGADYCLALRSDGTVTAWAVTFNGGTNVPAGLSNVVSVAANTEHNLALRADGTLAAWPERDPLAESLSNLVAVAAGEFHSLALKADGTVVAWGNNGAGQTTLPPDLTNVVALAGGGAHSLALKADGTVLAWGYGSEGGTNVPAGLTNVIRIAAGWYHNLALRADGTVVAWGRNVEGQCDVPHGLTNLVAIAAGSYHSLVMRADGLLTGWGRYPIWHPPITVPMLVPTGLTNVLAAAGGIRHSLALIADSPPALTMLLTDPRWNDGGFSVSVQSQMGRVYSLEYTDSLADGRWIALPLVAGHGGPQTLSDPAAAHAHRFYRLRQW